MQIPEGGDELGRWLEELREAHGLTQFQLGQDAGISARTIQRWEKGDGPVEEVMRLLTALDVRIEPPPPESVKALGAQMRALQEMIASIDDRLKTLKDAQRDGDQDAAEIEQAAARLRELAIPPPQSESGSGP